MAEATSHPAHPTEKPGLIGRTLSFISQAVGLLIISLLCSIVMEWIGIAYFWPEQGWRHAEQMLAAELEFLSENFRQSLLIEQPGAAIGNTLAVLEEWIWQRSGLANFAAGARAAASEETVWGGINQAYVGIESYVLGAVFVSLTFTARVGILLSTTPLTLLAVTTGFVDGLMRRDLRKFGAGRESSFVYHRVKRMILPCIFLPWLIYLSLPFSLNPLLVMLPASVLLGLTVALTTSSFKKYL